MYNVICALNMTKEEMISILKKIDCGKTWRAGHEKTECEECMKLFNDLLEKRFG